MVYVGIYKFCLRKLYDMLCNLHQRKLSFHHCGLWVYRRDKHEHVFYEIQKNVIGFSLTLYDLFRIIFTTEKHLLHLFKTKDGHKKMFSHSLDVSLKIPERCEK